jgi:hypothetical protein
LGRMIIPSFNDPKLVVETIKRIKKEPLTMKERKAVVSLLDPTRVHAQILRVLQKALLVKREEKNVD